jgi:hypothetical protein
MIIHARVRDENARMLVDSHLLNTMADKVSSTIYELNTSDWDDDSWRDFDASLRSALTGTRDVLTVWQFTGDEYTRFTIRGDE